jgi:hypothetical protein
MLATGLFSVVNPGVLIAIPFCLLAFFMPSKRFASLAIAALGVFVVATGDPSSGIWYAERGWAVILGGCFLALSLRWPEGRFLPKGLGAVLGTFLFIGLLFGSRPGDWEVVDWAIQSRMELAMANLLQAARASMGPERISVAFEATALETMAAQKDFRFNDQLVWVLITGVVAVLVSSGALARVGANAVVFVGALYALRGAGVVLFLTGGASLFGGILFLVGFLLVAPLVIMGAIFIGLGDTWFDLRARRASSRSGS